MYDVEEFRQNSVDIVSKFVNNPLFQENPAFARAVKHFFFDIDSVCHRSSITHVQEDEHSIRATRAMQNNSVGFFIEKLDDQTRIAVGLPSSDYVDAFICRCGTEGPYGYVESEGRNINYKNTSEMIVGVKVDGSLTVLENSAMALDINIQGNTPGSISAKRKEYDSNGVMYSEYDRVYSEYQFSAQYAWLNSLSSDLVYLSYHPEISECTQESTIQRNTFDTAIVDRKDFKNDITYHSVLPLHTEYTSYLADMVFATSEMYPTRSIIPPRSYEEAASIIAQEKNPKVAEGLKKYIKPGYSYDSTDPNSGFVYSNPTLNTANRL